MRLTREAGFLQKGLVSFSIQLIPGQVLELRVLEMFPQIFMWSSTFVENLNKLE